MAVARWLAGREAREGSRATSREGGGVAEYWIDGHNVLHRLAMGAGNSWERRREELVRRCASLRQPTWVVFDSRESTGRPTRLRGPGRVRVQFAADGKSADDLILDRLGDCADLSQVWVVTDDEELARNCRFHGARTLSVTAFGAKLRPDPTPTKDPGRSHDRKLSAKEVQDWMKYFGFDGKRDRDPDSSQ